MLVKFLNNTQRKKLQKQFNKRVCKKRILAASDYRLLNQLKFCNSIAIYVKITNV